MENAKKMLLIEPSLIEKFNQHHNPDNPISRLDTEMKNILSSNLDDRKKSVLYLQVLQRYLHFNEKSRRPIELPIISQNADFAETNIKEETQTKDPLSAKTSEEEEKEEVQSNRSNQPYTTSEILNLIPKTYSKKGESLLNLLSFSKNKIHWNNDGAVIIDNEQLPGSNIVDLINDLLRPLKKSDPIGWETFAKALKEIKIPLCYLGNPKRVEYIQKLMLKDLGEVSTDEEFSTPSSKYVKKIRKKLDWEKWNPY